MPLWYELTSRVIGVLPAQRTFACHWHMPRDSSHRQKTKAAMAALIYPFMTSQYVSGRSRQFIRDRPNTTVERDGATTAGRRPAPAGPGDRALRRLREPCAGASGPPSPG